MAQETVVTLIDDLEGGKASDTVSFSLNGFGYELELNSRNIKKLESALAPFIECARVTDRPRKKRVAKAHSNGHAPIDPRTVREWARANNIEVPAKGRVPQAVIEQFQAAGN